MANWDMPLACSYTFFDFSSYGPTPGKTLAWLYRGISLISNSVPLYA
jgi:hypothetical protein